MSIIRDTPQHARGAAAGDTPSIGSCIVVGSDGTEESSGALRIAALLQQKSSAHVEVHSAIAPMPGANLAAFDIVPPPDVDEARRSAALVLLEEQCASIRSKLVWKKSVTVGWPTEVIVDAAERSSASLIVIGIGRHRPIDRLLAAETAVGVVRRATVPVLAVLPRATQLPKYAIAAMDFSDSSIDAAKLAAELLGPGGRMTLAHTVLFPPAPRRDGTSWTEVYETGASDRLAELATELRKTGVSVDTVLLRGDAAVELVRYAKEHHADLIALGGHKQGLVDRLLIGSVTTRVVRGAPTSVLVVPQRVLRVIAAEEVPWG
jgi:nucleotide-binding universal stress UspA family protein